jgi:glycosyltransferase involved in cell wall biosynthesis
LCLKPQYLKEKETNMSVGRNMSERGLSVVLGTYNRKAFLKKTIGSVRKEFEQWHVPHEIIVVDGGSNDGTLAWLTRQKDVVSIIQHNRGTWQGRSIEQRSWGYFMNLGFKCAQRKYVCMISDDCLVVPGSLKNGYEEFEARLVQGKRLGALAFYWRNWPNSKKYFVITVKGQVYVNHGLYLRKALEEVNYINEYDYFFYCADTDLTFRLIKAGYTVEATTKALIEHCQHITVKIRRENKGKIKKDFGMMKLRFSKTGRSFSEKNATKMSWYMLKLMTSFPIIQQQKEVLAVRIVINV